MIKKLKRPQSNKSLMFQQIMGLSMFYWIAPRSTSMCTDTSPAIQPPATCLKKSLNIIMALMVYMAINLAGVRYVFLAQVTRVIFSVVTKVTIDKCLACGGGPWREPKVSCRTHRNPVKSLQEISSCLRLQGVILIIFRVSLSVYLELNSIVAILGEKTYL
jgi:hypothetical protein